MTESNRLSSSSLFSPVYIVLLVFFFLSGACGLIYEVVWQRMLNMVFGTSVYSVATILTTFMGGLALGSWYFGKKADTSKRPLALYGLMEIGIGVAALIIPLLIKVVMYAYVGLHHILPQQFTILTLLKFFLSSIVLLIPTILMGATLPVASRYIVRNMSVVGGRVGGLYGINTLGAVLGTVAAGYVMILAFGSHGTTFIAAAVNIVIGLIAVALDRLMPSPVVELERTIQPESMGAGSSLDKESTAEGAALEGAAIAGSAAEAATGETQEKYPLPRGLILLAVGVSGFCALAYEVFWTRTLTFYGWNSIYAFPTMLAAFLVGSAIGSLIITGFADRRKFPPVFYGLLQIIIALAALFTIWEFTAIGDFAFKLWRLSEPGWSSFVRAGFTVSILTISLPALLMGMVIPLAIRLYTQEIKKVGSSVGSVYAINTIGCVLGSFFAGFVFIPLFGITVSILIVTAFNLINGTIILMYGPLKRWRWTRPVTAIASVCILVLGIILVPKDRPISFYSPFFKSLERGEQMLFYKEGVGATVSVRQFFPHTYDNGLYKVIEADGINVAGTSPMLRTTQKVQGHIPLILYKAFTHNDPQYAFILGLGSGESSRCITMHNIKRLDCLELVPAERQANEYFYEINDRILENPKFRLTIEDARNFLLTTTTRYDVIESDSVHPEIDIATYTNEYFEIARDRLTENGIFSTWIPLFNLEEENFKIMMKTLHDVFPHIMIWYSPNYQNKHALLMGMKKRLQIDVEEVRKEMSKPEIAESLAEIGIIDAFDILSAFITDERAITDYVSASIVNDDSHMYLPHLVPRQTHKHDETVATNLGILRRLSMPVLPMIASDDGHDPGFLDSLQKEITMRDILMQGISDYYDGNLQAAADYFQKALGLFPDDEVVSYMLNETVMKFHLGNALFLKGQGNLRAAVQSCEKALSINPDSAEAHNILGMIYMQAGLYDDALEAFTKITQAVPAFADGYFSVAAAYYRQEKYDRAREFLEIALERNPYLRKAQRLLRNISTKTESPPDEIIQ